MWYWKEVVLWAKEKLFGAFTHGKRTAEMRMLVSRKMRRKDSETGKMSEKNPEEFDSRSRPVRKHCWMAEMRNVWESLIDHNRRLSMIENDSE
jgi:hypothetical protein